MRPLLLVLVLAPAALAHPLPTMRFDRTCDVRLTAGGVSVRYTVELNQWSMVRDPEGQFTAAEQAEFGATQITQKRYELFYTKKKALVISDRLLATANGLPLVFASEAAPEVHPNHEHHEFRFRFFAPWPKELDRSQPVQFKIDDTNFESVTGKLTLYLKSETSLDVEKIIDPEGLRGVSPLDLKPGDDEKLRHASARFRFTSKAPAAAPVDTSTEPVLVGERPGLAQDLWTRGLTALFDSEAGLGLLLLAAMLFGMAHAFTPGHGKTLVAAYLVGERGTVRHAVTLGVSTTLAHTGSVLGVAGLLWCFYRDGVPETAQGWLQFAGGMLILVVGIWLLLQRLRGRADHVHLFNDTPREPSFGWGRVILLGLGGGLIPCWDAVMLLLVAISAGRLAFAVPMLLAFSVGLALVLVLLGIGVVFAHRRGVAKFGDRGWFKALPIVSATLLVLMGLWLAREGVQLLTTTAKGS